MDGTGAASVEWHTAEPSSQPTPFDLALKVGPTWTASVGVVLIVVCLLLLLSRPTRQRVSSVCMLLSLIDR